ncbi:MAG: TIGR03087 family PEP-CTERM/XrtA system glycosyltransferase [Gammaproteobacteria bacterium]|nr:TIGR03087 family PEP-CTERM/XrtA system glycosyltransferase [Gammaproteobacteria bacterium]
MKKKLLFLVHRLPFPPNKGDKITSFNLLRYLAQRYQVYLGTFVDDPEDQQYVEKVRGYCTDTCIETLDPGRAKITSLRGLLTGEALSLPYLRNRRLADWTRSVIREQQPHAILIFSSPMAQYVDGLVPDTCSTVFDMEDVDSEKWRSYGQKKRWPMNWVYAREADKLLAYERRMAANTDVSVFVSADEASLFASLAPECAARTTYRTQGVDSDFFDPQRDYDNPYSPDSLPLVFTGAMDYWPNIEAATWFASEVFPRVRERRPQAEFYVVGMRPSAEVTRLGDLPGITVTGGVPDVRPYLAHARSAVLPLHIARGIQNKALEAMAMELPIVATPQAMVGIEHDEDFEARIADQPQAFAEAVLGVLASPPAPERRGRSSVLARYNWDANLRLIENLLESQPIPADRRIGGNTP